MTTGSTTFRELGESPHDAIEDFSALQDYEAESMSAGEPLEMGPSWLEIFDARVLSEDGPTLIFEFEVPGTGFMLPADGTLVQVFFNSGVVCDAVIQGGQSSPRGPHHPGLTVRLALQLRDQNTWQHDEAQILWHVPGNAEVRLHIALR